MKHLIWIITGIGWLMGCKEPVIENHTLLQGKEYRLWFLDASDMWNPKFLYFDQYGSFKTLIYDETDIFIPDNSHPLNGRWKSPADSVVVLNGQPYRIVIQPEDESLAWSRWVTLHHQTTGDSIRLLDACFPPDVPWYPPEDTRWPESDRVHYKQWKDEIQSSILLKGEKYKLYRYVRSDWGSDIRPYHIYYDNYGLVTSLDLLWDTNDSLWLFVSPYWRDVPGVLNWHQEGDTLFDGNLKSIIKDISVSGDTIKLLDMRDQHEYLYIDTKLPPKRQ